MDEDLTGRTGDLIAGLALFRDASVPAPSPELAAMFAATATATATAATSSALPTPRRAPVYKRILAGIPGKIAAGALGALLAGSVGAGALTGTMVLTSDEDETPAVEAPAVEDDVVVADDDEGGEEAAVDEVDDDGANDAAADADLAAVAEPTSVSEAAHTHEFDEVCGNHGRYVSWFARFGEEAECAVKARSEASGEAEAPAEEVAETTEPAEVETTTEVKSKGRSKSGTSGGNWQLEAERSAKGAKSDKSKGGR